MKPQVTIPFVCSIILHTALFLVLVLNLSFGADPRVLPPQPQVIQATLVKLEEQAPTQASQTQAERKASPKPEPAPTPPAPKAPPAPPRPDPAEAQQKAQEQQKQKQLEEQKRVEALKAKEAEAARLRKAKEARKAEAARKQKAEEERKRAEAERQRKAEAERKRKAEEDARRRAAEADRQRREELARAMAAEEQAMAAARQGQAAASFAGFIQTAVERSWSRPPSARTGMRVVLRIQMIGTGEVQGVSVVRSSGNAEFDQSAINAVKRASPFPRPDGLSAAEFRQRFGTFDLDFYPQDLRL